MVGSSPQEATRLIVFTDLDATLLDHQSYSWQPAATALEALRTHDFPLILCSSKTLAEMVDLARELATEAPIVAENGAFIAIPNGHSLNAHLASDTQFEDYSIKLSGLHRTEILEVAHTLRDKHGYLFQGFADWSVSELAQKTDLALESAERAANRLATEPIEWLDTTERWLKFEEAIQQKDIQAIRGGRFIHLMGDTDKANAMQEVVRGYKALDPTVAWTTVALGDSPNDLKMLSQADIGVVIPNPHRSEPLEINAANIIRAPHPGPLGWNTVVSDLVHSYPNHDVRISQDG